jgi:hypothetical protein
MHAIVYILTGFLLTQIGLAGYRRFRRYTSGPSRSVDSSVVVTPKQASLLRQGGFRHMV